MKTITLFGCLLLFGICTISSAQNQIDINELLSRFNESHMGAITDVFTSEELKVLEAHYAALRDDVNNFDNRGPKIRLYGPENVGGNFGYIDPMVPAVFNTIGPSGTADFDGAGAIMPGSAMGHVIDNAGNMYEVDIITGNYILVGTVTAPNGENFTGMEFNPNNGTLYAISTDGTTNSSTLSTIDPITMMATPIGNTGLRLPIALSVTGDGEILTYDIDDDFLYALSAATGLPTVKGSIGFNADFGGGLSYDSNTGNTYMTSFNPAVGDSQLRTVNTITGATTVVGTINPGPTSQMAWNGAVNTEDLGVSDIEMSNFQFAPNPATNLINVRATTTIEKVQIHGILGQQVLEETIGRLNGTITISSLTPGSYFMTVHIAGQKASYHFIKN